MTTHRVAVVPGDGTGPEVVAEAVKVLETTAGLFGFSLDLQWFDLGGERYLRSGETLPGEELDQLRGSDAILFGAIGHPDVAPGVLEQDVLLRMRRELNQYINLRPVRLHPGVRSPIRDVTPDQVNFVVIRENSEGLYVGKGGFTAKGSPFEVAIQESINTRLAIDRCIRYAFELARSRPDRHVTLCGKTNVLTYSWDLWQRVFNDVASDYPEVETDYAHVDAACLWMVEDPARFDVIVTDNMFGDIISDLGAAIQGGLGIAASGNINPEGVSMFEPVGGTAPGFEGTAQINPLAAIGAAALMLRQLGEDAAANSIESSVASVAGWLPSLRAGEMGMSTTEVGDRVVAMVGRSTEVRA